MEIVEPIADVLDAAHKAGVVHRDLKPSNIMIAVDGMVKLLDLGVARINDKSGATPLTLTGQIVGTTRLHVARAVGHGAGCRPAGVDGRADVNSLGVMVYEMTAGGHPFMVNSIGEMCNAHCNSNPRPLEELDASIPAAWSRAMLRAISVERGARDAGVNLFLRKLEGGGKLIEAIKVQLGG